MIQPLYDPTKSWDENFDNGPFGPFGDGKKFKQEGNPGFKVLGHNVFLPFGIAAGPLPTSRHIKAAFEKGFDMNVYKTQRSISFSANKFPNVLYLDIDGDLTLEKANHPIITSSNWPEDATTITITNSFGNPSLGPDFWVEDLKKALSYEGKGQLLIMSVVGTIKEGYTSEAYYEDFADTAFIAAQTGVKVIEINLSCPNVANESVLCYSPGAVYEITKRVKEKIGNTPLIAKLGYYSETQQDLLSTVIEKLIPFVAGVSVINTLAAPIVDKDGNQALPGPNRLKSGVCGAAIKWAGLDMVSRVYEVRDQLNAEFEIVGVGGVMTPADYQKYIKSGADIVMCATGAMWNPYLAQEIKKEIQAAKKYITISSF